MQPPGTPSEQEMHSQTPPHRLQPPMLAFVIAALVKHGRAGEVILLFEEQLAAVRALLGLVGLGWVELGRVGLVRC